MYRKLTRRKTEVDSWFAALLPSKSKTQPPIFVARDTNNWSGTASRMRWSYALNVYLTTRRSLGAWHESSDVSHVDSKG